MRLIYFTAILSIMTLTAQAQFLEQSIVKHVRAAEFLDIIEEDKGQLIDIRTPKEFDIGHIEGAMMIDYYAPSYKTNLDQLDKEKPIYIYCRSGNRTSRSVGLIQQLGFKEIVNLQYGLVDWHNSGYTLVLD